MATAAQLIRQMSEVAVGPNESPTGLPLVAFYSCYGRLVHYHYLDCPLKKSGPWHNLRRRRAGPCAHRSYESEACHLPSCFFNSSELAAFTLSSANSSIVFDAKDALGLDSFGRVIVHFC
jgi:hypothetical protein